MIKVIRTFVVTAILAGLALLIYREVGSAEERRAIAELEAMNQDMAHRIAAQKSMIERLGRTRRLARVEITGQRLAPDGTIGETDVLFIELDTDGGELARQQFTIPGDVLFIDAWTVRFSHEDVAAGHPLHGRTLVLLRRVYSDRMAPAEGFAIDTPGAVPPGYAGSDMSRFEQRLWEHFWEVATDPDLARGLGVRVAQGEAVYKPVAVGQAFRLDVDAAAGMTLSPLGPRVAAGPDDPSHEEP